LKIKRIFFGLCFAIAAAGLLGCSSSDSASKTPYSVISTFDKAMSSAGNNLQSSSGLTALRSRLGVRALSPADFCDEHGQPLNMNNSDPEYPGRIFYCKVAKNSNSPDTIQGAYSFIKQLSCALDQAGITFDGAEHSATVTVDNVCFSQQLLDKGEMPASMDITYTASQPASFNSNFQTGIVLNVPNFGSFTMATSVNGNKVEFLGYEDQSVITPNKTGGYVGQFDADTGQIRFEAMHDRYNCAGDGDCGWSRHDKIFLSCDSVDANGNCVGVKDVHGAASSIYKTGTYGEIATISGSFGTGVKTRLYTDSTETFNTPGSFMEITNNLCFSATSSTGGDCTGITGIELPSSEFHFTLFTGHTPVSTWYTTAGNQSFTSFSLND